VAYDSGGSANYVEQLVAPFRARIHLKSPVESIRRSGHVLVKVRGAEAVAFDRVFLACHSDQALALLSDAMDSSVRCWGRSATRRTRPCCTRMRACCRVPVAPGGVELPRAGAGARARVRDLQYEHPAGDQSASLAVRDAQCSHMIDPQRMLRRVLYQHPIFTPVRSPRRHAMPNSMARRLLLRRAYCAMASTRMV